MTLTPDQPDEPFWAALVPELTVADLDVSLRFYTLIGFQVRFVRDDPPFAYLELGAAQIMLETEHAGGWNVAALDRPLGRGINFQIEVPNAAAIATALAAAAIPLFREPRATWYAMNPATEEGQLELLVQDPDGYLLRFSQPLGRRVRGEE
jgi:catechol 2,3-dioxygenase-like lactoylglutathione lyase family enzyme